MAVPTQTEETHTLAVVGVVVIVIAAALIVVLGGAWIIEVVSQWITGA